MRQVPVAFTVLAGLVLGWTPGHAAEAPVTAPPLSPADQLNQKQIDLLRTTDQVVPGNAFLGPPLMVQSMTAIGALH